MVQVSSEGQGLAETHRPFSAQISIMSRIFRLKQYVQGWMAHYGCGLKYDDAVELDG
jgi:hypothetical protein